MKKPYVLLSVLIVLLIVLSGFFVVQRYKKHSSVPILVDTPSLEPQEVCFSYHQKATTDAPYDVDEFIRIVVENNSVKGTKSGTQFGPDMSNGYMGTLTGIREEKNLQLDFSYTIEGSRNIERELYTQTEDSLIKHRYRLVENKGILVPDMSFFVHDIIYTKNVCPTINN